MVQTANIGCPYEWKGTTWDLRVLERGKPYLSPSKVPVGEVIRFEFRAVVQGWPDHDVYLALDESLVYAMVREGRSSAPGVIHTVAVRVGRKGSGGDIREVVWLLPDGRKVSMPTLEYEELERAGVV